MKLEQQQQYKLKCEPRRKRINQQKKQWKISGNRIVEKAKLLNWDDPVELMILFWNIEDSKTQLNTLLDYRQEKFDIMILVETFATENIEIEFFTTSNQKAIRRMAGRPMGGVTIGNNKGLKMTTIITAAEKQSLCVEAQPPTYCKNGPYFWPQTELDEIIHLVADSVQKTHCTTVFFSKFRPLDWTNNSTWLRKDSCLKSSNSGLP